ncbi:hypothetical protein EDC04DRAFT_2774066 [Pisolithus marmoratus]|nr:hypothetical protein EDC04DRAFT_2774066 [Pisolithus marmoratus]
MSNSHSISRAGASHPSSPEPDNKVGLADEIVEGTLDMQINEATSGIVCRTLAHIYSLPVELLSRILLHAIPADAHRCDVHCHRKQELASVSRRWRDTIFNDPAFWTTISLTPQWTPSLVQAHVQRSACLLVDIEIRLWATPDELDDLPLLLTVAMRCSDRWRSLIFDQNLVILDSFLGEMRDAIVRPALVYLRTMHFFPPLPSTLRLMSEAFGFHPFPNDFRTLPSPEKLTTLDLRGIGKWVSDPTSIHFPHLASLTLAVEEPADPLKYIVAPQLRHFCFHYSSVLHTLDPGISTDRQYAT